MESSKSVDECCNLLLSVCQRVKARRMPYSHIMSDVDDTEEAELQRLEGWEGGGKKERKKRMFA